MRIQRENVLLRAYFRTADRIRSRSAPEAFLARAREAGCRGATVLVAAEGFLPGTGLLRRHPLRVVEDLPLVVEVIDTAHRVDGLLRGAGAELEGRLATRERAAILVFRRAGGGTPAPEPGPGGTEGAMPQESEGTLLRVFIDESDREGGKGVARELLERALAAGLDAGLVLRSQEGFGAHHAVHTTRLEIASMDLPVVVEILGGVETVRAFVPLLDGMVKEGIVTMEGVRILRYPPGA
jgi:uncharacterized protein